MANVCDGCGERATRLTYPAAGPAAGRWFCRDCASGRKKMTRLAWFAAFRFRVAEVLPPSDPTTVPALRLMMAVDDVRRAQLQFVEASERLDDPAEKHRALGDLLYSVRLLFSHLHEAGHALRQLDGWAARDETGQNRVNALFSGNREAMAALRKVRKFFSARAYRDSLIRRVRNVIGSHYAEGAVAELVKEEFTGDALLESTAASVGGVARMADPIVRAIMNRLNGGDFMADEAQTQKVQDALVLSGHLISFVDHLFDALMRTHLGAVVEKHESVVDVPPLVARAAEAVDAARRRPLGEQRSAASAREHTALIAGAPGGAAAVASSD